MSARSPFENVFNINFYFDLYLRTIILIYIFNFSFHSMHKCVFSHNRLLVLLLNKLLIYIYCAQLEFIMIN